MVNKNYARPINDGEGIEYAPVILPPSPHEPGEAEYNAAGWYKVAIEPPEAPDGMTLLSIRYKVWYGKVVAEYSYKPIPGPTMADFDKAMENHLRHEREARGYTTREPDAYLTSSVERWAKDAADWVAHRDDVMEYALSLINAVQSGEREPPTMDEFVSGLPIIEWTMP